MSRELLIQYARAKSGDLDCREVTGEHEVVKDAEGQRSAYLGNARSRMCPWGYH